MSDSNRFREGGIRRPPKGFRGAARAARDAAIRGEDMPTLRELQKRVPLYIEVISQGTDGLPYRRFYYRSTLFSDYFYCMMQSEERVGGRLPEEGETLILYPMHRLKVNEATMSYEVDQAIAIQARDVTYSGPDSSKVARMLLRGGALLPNP
jgi:hypothetical protein